MISRRQQILLKRAQREAGLSDDEYREALETATGCRSSRDPRLDDRALDIALAYFEAIYWRKVDAGALQPSGSASAIFRQRAYWASKNTRQETSRDRYNRANLGDAITSLEQDLAALGFGPKYCTGIRRKTIQDKTDPHALAIYHAALLRTLRAKRNAPDAVAF